MVSSELTCHHYEGQLKMNFPLKFVIFLLTAARQPRDRSVACWPGEALGPEMVPYCLNFRRPRPCWGLTSPTTKTSAAGLGNLSGRKWLLLILILIAGDHPGGSPAPRRKHRFIIHIHITIRILRLLSYSSCQQYPDLQVPTAYHDIH